MKISNDIDSMVMLWRKLECTQRDMHDMHMLFCPRGILKLWFVLKAKGDFVWQVCHLSGLEGYELLPDVHVYPHRHRELLRAIIAVTQGIGMRHVDLKALDRAYSIAFPHSTPLNISKKGRHQNCSR